MADAKRAWAARGGTVRRKGTAQSFGGGPPELWGPQAKLFGEDRTKMRMGAARMHPSDAAATYKSYLRRLADMLHEQAYLLGDKPCIADFAAYPPLWFTRTQTSVMADILDATPPVLAWMDRMATIGHGTSQSSSAADSVASCPASAGVGAVLSYQPLQDEHGLALGTRGAVASASCAPEPHAGDRRAATAPRSPRDRARPGDQEEHHAQRHQGRAPYIPKAANGSRSRASHDAYPAITPTEWGSPGNGAPIG